MITSHAHHQDRAFAEVKRLSLAGLDGPELLRRVAGALRRAVPFEAYCASTIDPYTHLITHGIAEGMGGESAAGEAFFERVYFEEDLHQIASMLRERRPVALLSETTGGKLERSLRYRELLEPLGFAHELGSVFTDGSAWGGMDLIRETNDPDFDAREVKLIKKITPHVGAGLKAAALRSRASVEPAPDDTPGVLTLDRKGRVLSHTPSVRPLLSDLGGSGLSHEALPVSVRMVAAAVGRALSPETDRESNLVPRVRVRACSGRWLTLHGSLTEPAAERPGETVVVISPTKPEDVAWLNAASYNLTSREEEVIQNVLRGLSTRQISSRLFISEYTVQRHLQNAFEKVGVRSRGELLKRLFFESLLPGMIGG